MNQFNKDHPDVSVTRIENIRTSVTYTAATSQGNRKETITVVNVIVYTQKKEKEKAR
jgi:hypothetical protein